MIEFEQKNLDHKLFVRASMIEFEIIFHEDSFFYQLNRLI